MFVETTLEAMSDSFTPRVVNIISDATGLDAPMITPESTIDGLGIDSLSLIDICVRCEEEFGVRITDEDALGWRTIADMVDFVDGHSSR
jgi:acyl carrier protein